MATRRGYRPALEDGQEEYLSKHEKVINEMKPRLTRRTNLYPAELDANGLQTDSDDEEKVYPDIGDGISQHSTNIGSHYSTQSESLPHLAHRRNQSANKKPKPRVVKPQYLRSSPTSSFSEVAEHNAGLQDRSREKHSRNHSSSTPVISQIRQDSWGLVKFMFRVMGASYSIWKWILLLYVLWLGISYTFAIMSIYATETLSPVCSLWMIGPRIPLCRYIVRSESASPPDVTKLNTSQTELVVVMDHVGHNYDLARDMVGHEFAVRDLRIRVGASKLPRKKEIVQELGILLGAIKKGAQGTSRMTAKVGKVVDMYKAFDEHAISSLETIDNQHGQSQSLSLRILSAISPRAAWELATPDLVEREVKSLFLTMTTKVGMKVKTVIDDTYTLNHDFNIIIETLDRIKDLIQEEFGELPRHSVLQALWESLVRPDELAELHSHGDILTDMTHFCEDASEVMQGTQSALLRVEAELQEFRDSFAAPGLILEEYPLKVIISMLKSSMKALDASKQEFGRVESGEKPSKDVTRKVTVVPKVVVKTRV